MQQTKVQQKPEWFRLDNAATIFPGQNSKTWSNVFRICVQLKREIEPEKLEQALKNILPRFTGFDVRIRRGFFWYYFEKNPSERLPVMPDVQNPCYRVKFKENNGYLFRVYYHGSRLSVDTYHAVSDGYGTCVFTCSLAAEYLRLCGETIPCGEYVLCPDGRLHPDELEDSFRKYATSHGKLKRAGRFVYHAVGTKLGHHMVNMTSGIIDFDSFHKLTQQKGVTVTEYLAAMLLDIHYRKQKNEGGKQKEVSVQIPVNLRKSFPSHTLRNFVLCLRAVIDPKLGEYSFDDLLKEVTYQLRLANDPKKLNAMMSANMGIERNPLLKVMPLSVKNIGVTVSFLITGEQTTSTLISNLGLIRLPEEMQPHIEKIMFSTGPGKLNGARCGVISFMNKLVVTFANVYEENDIEREFFTHLVKSGVHVKIESNRV